MFCQSCGVETKGNFCQVCGEKLGPPKRKDHTQEQTYLNGKRDFWEEKTGGTPRRGTAGRGDSGRGREDSGRGRGGPGRGRALTRHNTVVGYGVYRSTQPARGGGGGTRGGEGGGGGGRGRGRGRGRGGAPPPVKPRPQPQPGRSLPNFASPAFPPSPPPVQPRPAATLSSSSSSSPPPSSASLSQSCSAPSSTFKSSVTPTAEKRSFLLSSNSLPPSPSRSPYPPSSTASSPAPSRTDSPRATPSFFPFSVRKFEDSETVKKEGGGGGGGGGGGRGREEAKPKSSQDEENEEGRGSPTEKSSSFFPSFSAPSFPSVSSSSSTFSSTSPSTSPSLISTIGSSISRSISGLTRNTETNNNSTSTGSAEFLSSTTKEAFEEEEGEGGRKRGEKDQQRVQKMVEIFEGEREEKREGERGGERVTVEGTEMSKKEQQTEKKSKYEELLALAKTEDFSEMEKLKFIYISGQDAFDRHIVVIIGNLIPADKVDFATLILYFIWKLDMVVEEEHVLIVTNSGMSAQSKRANLTTFLRLKEMLPRKYKKNAREVYILHPTTSTKMFFRAFRPFVSATFWRKLHYVFDPSELYRKDPFKGRSILLPEEVINFSRPKTKVFGGPLDEMLVNTPQGWSLPQVIHQSVFHLILEGLEVEGIFRVSGDMRKVSALRDQFESGQAVDLSNYEPHTVASCFKMYLRMLPEPLLTFNLYQPFLNSHETYIQKGPEAWISETSQLLASLPEPNQNALQILFLLLHKLQAKSEINKMTANNLSIVFGPTLLDSPTLDPKAAVHNSGMVNEVVCWMINWCETLILDRQALG